LRELNASAPGQILAGKWFTGKILGDKELAGRFWIAWFPVVITLTTRLVAFVNTDTSILTRLRGFLRQQSEENLLWGEWVSGVGEIFA
jgi:hypothetical protein